MKEIPLSQGKVAWVDDEDYERVIEYKWYANLIGKVWYAVRTKSRKTVSLHQFVMGEKNIDHINGDGLDNRKENLRVCTHQQNRANSNLYANNSSGFKGVSWYKNYEKWEAYIRIDGKKKRLGYFDSLIRAACVYDDAARQVYGDFARLNFPRG